MAHDLLAVEGGLADPVFDGQAIFRSLMQAFAEPGTVADLGARVSAPAALVPAAAAVLAALADGDTPVWMVDPHGANEAAARWIRFQTGAPVTTDPAVATFAVLSKGDAPASWSRFPGGMPDYPDRSATLLLPIGSFAGGAPLVLSGPGIETERGIAPSGLPTGFTSFLAKNRATFPLGVDLILVSGTAVLALPRSTRIREA